MAGLVVAGVMGGVAKIKDKRKAKARATAEQAEHDERENRFVSEKERWAAEDRLNAQRSGGEGASSSSGAAAAGSSSMAPMHRHDDAELPTYDEASSPQDDHRSELPPYDAPMSPATRREFEDYLAVRSAGSSKRERSPNAPEGETEEQRRKRKHDEFWRFRGGGWWSMAGMSLFSFYGAGIPKRGRPVTSIRESKP